MAKVRLLNDGGYGCFTGVQFPVEVYVTELRRYKCGVTLAEISIEDLMAVAIDDLDKEELAHNEPSLPFVVGTECELVSF